MIKLLYLTSFFIDFIICVSMFSHLNKFPLDHLVWFPYYINTLNLEGMH